MLPRTCTVRGVWIQLKGREHRALEDVSQWVSQKTVRQDMHKGDPKRLRHLPMREPAFEPLAYKEHLCSSVLSRETSRKLQLHSVLRQGLANFPLSLSLFNTIHKRDWTLRIEKRIIISEPDYASPLYPGVQNPRSRLLWGYERQLSLKYTFKWKLYIEFNNRRWLESYWICAQYNWGRQQDI